MSLNAAGSGGFVPQGKVKQGLMESVNMISRRMLKTEIDRVRSEHLELLYGIIKLLEDGARKDTMSASAEAQVTETGTAVDWHDFLANTYGCLSDAPISRGEQGRYENRESVE